MSQVHGILDHLRLFLNDPIYLVKSVGYFGVMLIIFAETGLLFGFFLPGDSLLVATGLFAAASQTNIVTLMCVFSLAAIVGDGVGFFIGKSLGILLYTKKDSFFFRKKHIEAAHAFYDRHGGKTIILARFIPIVRTFVPAVAGAAKMSYLHFVLYNVLGGILWVCGMLATGYYLDIVFGKNINKEIHLVIIAVVLISFLPLVVSYVRARRKDTP